MAAPMNPPRRTHNITHGTAENMTISVEMALEDLNAQIADLCGSGFDDSSSKEEVQDGVTFTQAGIESGGSQAKDFSDSCQAIVQQVHSLEEALGGACRENGEVVATAVVGTQVEEGSADIVKCAVVRGMLTPPTATTRDTTAVRSV